MTPIHAPDLYPRKTLPCDRTRVHDAAIRRYGDADPLLVAALLGVAESFVCQRQRALGLRKCANPRDRK